MAAIRKLVIKLAWLLIVFIVFAAGIGIYFAASASWAVLVSWWPPLAAGAAAVIAFGAWWLWWRLPKRQVDRLRQAIRDPKARTDVEDNYRKTIGQLLGGVAVLVGAGFAYLQFQQQQTSAHDLLISNQVAKGFELLGNKDGQIEQRLGGIYALEGVMNDSEQYYRPVLESLCAFVRNETQTKTGDNPPATEIEAALSVIRRRRNNDRVHIIGVLRFTFPEATVNLTGAHIPKAYLGYADLAYADLAGADLAGAHLIGADLRDAHLIGANLRGADLRDARNLTQNQLDDACGDENTKLDPPLTIKPCPPEQSK